MGDAGESPSEVTPAYRTLDEPSRLLGLALAQWGALIVACGLAYGWLMVSPLPWRANVSLVVVLGGGPLVLLILREQGALSAAQLIAAVGRWRTETPLLVEVDPGDPPSGGAVVLDEAPEPQMQTGPGGQPARLQLEPRQRARYADE